MAGNVKFRIVAVIVDLYNTARSIFREVLEAHYQPGFNFSVCYTAACLVRSNMSVHIYDGAEQNTNPQTIPADPKSFCSDGTSPRNTSSHPFRYLYPPTLADLVAPFSSSLAPLPGLYGMFLPFL